MSIILMLPTEQINNKCCSVHHAVGKKIQLEENVLFCFIGSSTACIMSLDCSTGILYSANLGDSGYTIIRNGEIIAESQTLIHYFNCPYQFSNPPPGFNTTGMDK